MSEKIVQLNEEVIKGQIKELVRGSVEEALIEMYLAGVSVRRVEDIIEALWGSKVSPATISELNKKAYVHIEEWQNRPLQDPGGEIFPDGNSALMLVCARLRHVAGTQWGNKKHMNMKHLETAPEDASIAG